MTEDTLQQFREQCRKQYRATYYDKSGNPISQMDWRQKSEDFDYKVIKQENLGKYFISTVWLGLDHNIYGEIPLIFETMIFIDEDKKEEGNCLHLWQERYYTESQAIKGHKDALILVKQALGMKCEL